MQVTVIDTKKNDSTICSATEAARIVGVCYLTVLRWSYDSKKKEFNHYTIYFNTKIVKQKKRGVKLW